MNQDKQSSSSENITILTRMRGNDQKSKYSKLKLPENLSINISQLPLSSKLLLSSLNLK